MLTQDAANGARLAVGVLGAFQVRLDGQWTLAPTRQVAKLGAALAGWPGVPVDNARLMSAVWGDSPPTTAQNTLHVHVSTLRRLVGKESVKSTTAGYVLVVRPEDVDVFQFQVALADAARLIQFHHFQRASERLLDALSLWRGVPYTGVDDPDLNARRARLVELREQAREDLLECRLELARDPRALALVIAHAKELVVEQPRRMRYHVLLVRALAAAGRPAEALSAYEVAVLAGGGAGVEPGNELAEVHAAVHANDPSLRPLASRFVTNVVPARRSPERVVRVAESARMSLVAEGTNVVWIVCPVSSPGWAALPGALVEGLAGDYATGVVLVDEGDVTPAGALAVLQDASKGKWQDLAAVPDVEAMAVIIRAPDPLGAMTLIDQLVGLAHPPRVVVLSEYPAGLPDEVVIEVDALA